MAAAAHGLKDLGLWGLDAPEDLGGADLPTRGHGRRCNEELGRTRACPSPCRRTRRTCGCCMATVTEAQKKPICEPYVARRDGLGDRASPSRAPAAIPPA